MRFEHYLNLIETVNNSFKHISELEALSKLLKYSEENIWLTMDETKKLHEICCTTHNSHYDYKLFTKEFQNPEMHINVQKCD